MLTLRVVQAKFGDCLILIFGDKNSPHYMLIDGGPGGVYRNFLRPELQKIKKTGGIIDLLVLSHIDGDHIVGLIDLTEELKEQQADEEEPIINIKEIWMNTFSDTIGKNNQITQAVQSLNSRAQNIQSIMPETDLAFKSINQGNILRRNALLLDIPLNQIMGGESITFNALPDPIEMENVKITIIGPNQENLEQLRKEWEKWIRENEAKIMMADTEIMAYLDKSVPNLSSLMFLLEADGKRMLFTGDGRGDFILEGLEKANLLNDDGTIYVDVFKVPHHGSIRNASEDFFLKVKADKYIISGDGHHGNPELETLELILKSAVEQKRKIQLICTNKTEATEKMEKRISAENRECQIFYLEKGTNCMDINLHN